MDITPDASVAMDIDNLEDEIPSSSPDNSGHALWKASQTPNIALRDLIVESSESVTCRALNKHVPRWDGPSSPQERRRSAPYNIRHRPPPRRSASTGLPSITLTSTNLSGAIPTLFNLIEKVQSADSGDENSEHISSKAKNRGREKAATGRKTRRSSMLSPAPKGKGKEKERPQDSDKDVNKKRRSGTLAAPIPTLSASSSKATFSDVSMLDVTSDNMEIELAVLAPPPAPLLIPTRRENVSGRSRTSPDGEVPESSKLNSGKAHGKRPSAPSKVVETTSPSNDVAHVAPTLLPEPPSRPKTTSQIQLGDTEKAAACLSSKANKAPSGPSNHSSTRNLRSSSSVSRTEVIRQALESNRDEGRLPSVSTRQNGCSSSRGVTPQPTHSSHSSNGSRPPTFVASSRSISRQPSSQLPVATQLKLPSTDPCYRPPQLGMGMRRVSSAPTAQPANRPLPTHQKGFKPPLLSGNSVPKPVERPPPPSPPPPPQNEASSEDTSFDCSFDLDPEELDNAMQQFD